MRFSIMVLIAVLFQAASALADFRIAEGGSDITAGPKRNTTNVLGEIGSRPSHIQAQSFPGVEIPIGEALKRITPSGWRGYSKGARLDGVVGWDRTAEWPDALAKVLEDSGNRAVIDWEKQTITVYQDVRKTAAAPKKPAQPQPGTLVPTVSGKWTLRAGREIDRELEGWAKKSGWQLNWQMQKTWKVAADAEFTGDFVTAITKVVELLYSEGRPIRMKLWEGNRVADIYSSDVR